MIDHLLVDNIIILVANYLHILLHLTQSVWEKGARTSL
jgi:hypothetical protein